MKEQEQEEQQRKRPTALGKVKAPRGWVVGVEQVKVATPQGDEEREIAYYQNSIAMKFVLIPAGEFISGRTPTTGKVDRDWKGGATKFRGSAYARRRVRQT